MIKIKQAVIVEGKYDKIKLAGVLDAIIIQTDGFAVFKDRDKQRLIKRLAQTRGIVILTDSDSAGFKIRSFIGGMVGKEMVRHAYIPDVFLCKKEAEHFAALCTQLNLAFTRLTDVVEDYLAR